MEDLEKFKGMQKLGGARKATYESIVDQLEKLKVPWVAWNIGMAQSAVERKRPKVKKVKESAPQSEREI